MYKPNKKKYMMIEVRKDKCAIVNDILAVFVRRGYFTTDDIEVSENVELKEYWIDILNLGFDTAVFVGDILDAALGDAVGWFHYESDPGSEDMKQESE